MVAVAAPASRDSKASRPTTYISQTAATESTIISARWVSRSSVPTTRAIAAPIPGTMWASGPARFRTLTYGGSPSANCCPL